MKNNILKKRGGWKISEEHKKIISIANKGKKLSEETKSKIRDANIGKKLSKETIKKVSEGKKGQIPWNKGNKKRVYCDLCGGEIINHRAKMCFNCYRGENHLKWRGGIAKDRRTGLKYKQFRSNVFERDNWTCQTCGIRGCYLEVHHINSWAKYPKLRYNLNNAVTLCQCCHKLTNNYKGKNNGFLQDNSNQENNSTE